MKVVKVLVVFLLMVIIGFETSNVIDYIVQNAQNDITALNHSQVVTWVLANADKLTSAPFKASVSVFLMIQLAMILSFQWLHFGCYSNLKKEDRPKFKFSTTFMIDWLQITLNSVFVCMFVFYVI